MTAAERLKPLRQTPVRFTADEFMELVRHPPVAEWTGKVELVKGNIVRMAPANIPHWRVQHELAQRLRAIYTGIAGDWLVGPEPTVRFADRVVRLPDVAVFRQPRLDRDVFDVADLYLAVEVADTSLRIDLGPKLRDYAEARVPHYWVADLKAREVLAMTGPDGVSYGDRRSYPFGTPVPVPGTKETVIIE